MLVYNKKLHSTDIEVSTKHSVLTEKVANKQGITLSLLRGGCKSLIIAYAFENIEYLPKVEKDNWSAFGNRAILHAKWTVLQNLIAEFKLKDDFVIKAFKEFNKLPPGKRKLNAMGQFPCGTKEDTCYIGTGKTNLYLRHEFLPKNY
ncbi:MAG: hypothetical protein ABUK01_05615 [Leptospirales bacterium]